MIGVRRPRKIVIFADGTGNAFSRQESNVWRLYKALDLSKSDQIALYLPGVGTSGFKPWATVDAATGLGVPSNVRKAYQFLCRNWQQGDEIYFFGFSRGAFTVRTLIGMMHYEGLVCSDDDAGVPVALAELDEIVMAAWRSYRAKTAKYDIKSMSPAIPLVRGVRDLALSLWRRVRGREPYSTLPDEHERRFPSIAFVGLFDTVEAYGVPVEEFRKAIDWGFWPISFRNRQMSQQVQKACHALSLDDERTTFDPLRIDPSPKDLQAPGRIEEVWFAGVHSDVGGGYPEDGLAHIPLTWMIERLDDVTSSALRFRGGARAEFQSRACAFEPIHDSRAGGSVFYRYGPRNLSNLPAASVPIVHPSVIDKMMLGANLYVPLSLGVDARVATPSGSPVSIVTALASNGVSVDAQGLSTLRNLVWRRRINYFATLFAAIAILSLPVTADTIKAGLRSPLAAAGLWKNLGDANDGVSSAIGGPLQLVFGLAPSWLQPWSDVFIRLPYICSGVLAIAILLYLQGSRLKDETSRVARAAWFAHALSQPSSRADSIASKLRQSDRLRSLSRVFSARLVPALLVVLMYAVVLVLLNHLFQSYEQGAGRLCPYHQESGRALEPVEGSVSSRYKFRPSERCHATGLYLEKGRPYRVEISVLEAFDETADPVRLPVLGLVNWRSVALVPLRRWWSAGWWQPIGRIAASGNAEWPMRSAYGEGPGLIGAKPGSIFVSEFTATESGEFFVFVNDAFGAIPILGPIETAYANNRGLATVTISPARYSLAAPK